MRTKEKRKKEKKKKSLLSSFLREKTEKGKPGERKRAEIGVGVCVHTRCIG